MIDPKAFDVFLAIYMHKSSMSYEEIEDYFGLRPRTLRELIKNNRDEFERKAHARLVSVPNQGYTIEADDSKLLKQYLLKTRMELRDKSYEMPSTTTERVEYIIRTFLMTDTPIKIDDLADELIISRSTLNEELKQVREKLDEHNLKLMSQGKEGLVLEGSEQDIQSCISDTFFYTDYHLSTSFQKEALGTLGAKYESDISDIIGTVLEKNHYHMTDIGIHNLVVHILIALYRVQDCAKAIDSSNIPQDKYKLEMSMAKEIRDEVTALTSIRIPDSDLAYMAVHMIGTRIFEEKDSHMISSETLNLVREILTKIKTAYGVDFFNDIDLFTMLCLHIEPLINRLENHIKTRNPLLLRIKEENHFAFDIAIVASDVISKRLHVFMDENETSYLALHFALALERRGKEEKKKVLTVCASGAGSSRLLKYRLQERFKDTISQIDSTSMMSLQKMDLSSYDLIISTLPLNFEPEVPVLVIDSFLTEDDEKNIEDIFDHGNLKNGILDGFDQRLYLFRKNCNSPSEAIHLMCGALNSVISLPKEFEEKVIQREMFSSTYFGHGIATPHPTTLIVNDNKVCAMQIENGITWYNGKQVHWIFLLALNKEENEEGEQIVQALYSLIKDIETMKKLKGPNTYSVFLQTIEKKYRNNSMDRSESIFQ